MEEHDRVEREIAEWRPGQEEKSEVRSQNAAVRSGTAEEGTEGQTTALEWRVHRARETPGRTVVALVLVAAFLVFSFRFFGPLLGLVALAVLAAALHSYFLPISYRFDTEGIHVDKRAFRYSYEWGQFRRWFRTTGGVVVSPFSRRTFLDNFRGVHLLLPREPGPVLEYLERKMPGRDARPLDTNRPATTMTAEEPSDEAETPEAEED
ncbi:hypothetical protein JXB37_06760 [candidate division WOR-3 bacterium]|nr:hypothetical protein [candidate division WOR-3 bacterium]